VRIIAGEAKGHKLKTLKGLSTRPTPERVREAIFNIWGFKIKNVNFLDLFAGSGAMGIEALSRGAKFCHFNDHQQVVCRLLRENIKKCGFEDHAIITCQDVFVLIRQLARKQIKAFDIIYLDPPYDIICYEKLLVNILEAKIFNPTGMIVCETSIKTVLQTEYVSGDLKLKILRKNRYGDTAVWFYKLWGEE